MVGKTITAVEDTYGTLRALHFSDGTMLTLDYDDSWGTSYEVLDRAARQERAHFRQGERERSRVVGLTLAADPTYYERRRKDHISTLTGFSRAWAEEMEGAWRSMNQASALLSFGDHRQIPPTPNKRPHARKS